MKEFEYYLLMIKGKQEPPRDQSEHLIELKPSSPAPQRYYLALLAAASRKASPTLCWLLDHVTGGGVDMLVVVQRVGKGIPAQER